MDDFLWWRIGTAIPRALGRYRQCPGDISDACLLEEGHWPNTRHRSRESMKYGRRWNPWQVHP